MRGNGFDNGEHGTDAKADAAHETGTGLAHNDHREAWRCIFRSGLPRSDLLMVGAVGRDRRSVVLFCCLLPSPWRVHHHALQMS